MPSQDIGPHGDLCISVKENFFSTLRASEYQGDDGEETTRILFFEWVGASKYVLARTIRDIVRSTKLVVR